jgi:transcriptional regulator with XRE-family HTH domain
MKSIDIKAFRKANNLTQSELGDYLGCTKAFISTIEKGNRPLPKEMLSRLLDNMLDWDISMLTNSLPVQVANPVTEDALITELRSQIEKLEAKVDNLNQELGEKNALIKLLRNGEVESI